MNEFLLERYELRGIIGRGGLGEVLLAKDTTLNRLVAIKRLFPSEEAGENVVENALKEARELASLIHPNIVTIFDVFQFGRDLLVAMEYVRGRTLQQIADFAPVATTDFFTIALQSLQALAAVHDQGILHRDIKPGNIMVSVNKRMELKVKVLDFGLSALAESVKCESFETREVLGSIYTMAPEQFEQRGEDERTDIYALGCTLYFILAGFYPFRGDDVNAVIDAHLNHSLVPISEIRSDLPAETANWLMRLLAADRDQRPPNAIEAIEELQTILVSQPMI